MAPCCSPLVCSKIVSNHGDDPFRVAILVTVEIVGTSKPFQNTNRQRDRGDPQRDPRNGLPV